ncbi:MBL fold metallo-hydrolase [Candidatus Shapirobacteria bacterium]|nr:MBL fold metallo-hydrolase [Candidatus Shapirobacteria bacterium]
MNTITILIEGYAHPGKDGIYIASPTTTLIDTVTKKFIVDPGTNSKLLLEALSKNNLKISDITGVYLSHYHPDHFLNIRLFPGVDIYDGGIMWREDEEHFYKDYLPGTDIKILSTPGHSPEDATLLVTTKDGTVAIAPDVFWWEDGEQKSDTVEDLMNLVDPFATDIEALKKSRQTVLEVADFIIPGHGKMFKNPQK